MLDTPALGPGDQRTHDRREVIPLIRPDDSKLTNTQSSYTGDFNQKPSQRIRERVIGPTLC
jgi:hypothetical protein